MTIASPSRMGRRGRATALRVLPLWLLLVPALTLALTFKFIPMIQGIYFSLHKVQPYLGDKWVAFDNYTTVLSDSGFREALGHTLILAAVQTAGAVVLGLVLALILEGVGVMVWLTRTIVVLPVVTAMAVIGEIWRLIFYPDPLGFANTVLAALHLPTSKFLDSPATALMSIAVVGIWASAPYNMVVFLAGLAGVDRTQYEAAAVDGASRWHRLWHIVIPNLRASFVIVLTLSAIRALGVFTEVYVLTGGGPAGSTTVWMTQIYARGFERHDIGVASAASVLLLAVTALLTVGVQAVSRRKEL